MAKALADYIDCRKSWAKNVPDCKHDKADAAIEDATDIFNKTKKMNDAQNE
jgi:hypothetical protein